MGAAFGSDPRWIYVAATPDGGWGNWQIGVVDRETGKTFMRTGQFQSAMRPTLSPDGRWLVYATRKGAASTTASASRCSRVMWSGRSRM